MEFEKLQEIIADVLNVDPNEVAMETTFADDLGADSLDVFQIVMGIEEEFDIQIEAEEAEHSFRHHIFPPDDTVFPEDPPLRNRRCPQT